MKPFDRENEFYSLENLSFKIALQIKLLIAHIRAVLKS